MVQAPEEYVIGDLLDQVTQDETFLEGGGPESLSADEPPRIGMEPVKGPAVRFWQRFEIQSKYKSGENEKIVNFVLEWERVKWFLLEWQ